jgi:hypothetical protein
MSNGIDFVEPAEKFIYSLELKINYKSNEVELIKSIGDKKYTYFTFLDMSIFTIFII